MADKLKLFPNERVGLADAEAGMGGGLALEESLRRGETLWLPAGRTTGQAATSARIMGGFGFSGTPVGSASATLERGSGIFPYLEGSDLKFGFLQGNEGPATDVLNFSASPNGTYAVYVRVLFNPGTVQNRVFWDPSGSPAREFIDNIPTRDVSTWEALAQDSAASPPGNGEWVKIYEITVVAFLITAVVDFRHFFYEGSAHPSDAYAHEWGDGANDRNDDRTLAPVTDEHRWKQMVRRQLADIIDLGGAHKSTAQNTLQGVFPSSVITPQWRRMFQWKSARDQEMFRYTPRGRLATTRRFKDDFFYHGSWWGTTPANYGPYYDATIVGGACSINKGASAAVFGAVGGANDNTLLETDDHFLMRSGGPTNESALSMYARLSILDVSDSVTRVGFLDGASNWRVWLQHDAGVGVNWELRADDGAGGTLTVVSAAVAVNNAVTHLELHIDPFLDLIYASFDVGGTLSNLLIGALPGAGATFLGFLALGAYHETISGGANQMTLDYWEAWDESLHAGVLV